MRLKNVTFETWLRSHQGKDPQERWLRELYPWPVLAQIDVDLSMSGVPQPLEYAGVHYTAILNGTEWQADHGTYKYEVNVESDGLGWHSRSYADDFVICGAPDGSFVTLFHAGKKEPLEKTARAFFRRDWKGLRPELFQTLAVSRFLGAALVGQVASEAFADYELEHYPSARILRDAGPMFACGSDLWVGHRYYSEDAYAWARRHAGEATRVVAIYFADTRHQFRTDLPAGAEAPSIAMIDATDLHGRYQDLIRVLLRNLELPEKPIAIDELDSVIHGRSSVSAVPIDEADVSEALAALKRPCRSKSELRYQMAAAVLLNAWIEEERRLGFRARKKFYAFKARVDELARWAATSGAAGVSVWADMTGSPGKPVLYVRIDGVDFSFHEIPLARDLVDSDQSPLEWTGVRLKPIAPLVLAWAGALNRRPGS